MGPVYLQTACAAMLVGTFVRSAAALALTGEMEPPETPSQPFCGNFAQITKLNGSWVDHKDPSYQGLYDQLTDCPAFASDFNCKQPNLPDDLSSPDQLAAEFRKVYHPDECALRPFDAQGFAECVGPSGRLIMIGGPSIRQSFLSLACLLAPTVAAGAHAPWAGPDAPAPGNYTARGLRGDPLRKLAIGSMRLQNGAQIFLRSFGRFNMTLWDDVFAEFGELTPRDAVLVNFGGMYPRFKVRDMHSWNAYIMDVDEVIKSRLAFMQARVIWKEYAPAHFGGALYAMGGPTGAYTGVEELLGPDSKSKRVPLDGTCMPATAGEFWYNDHVREVLQECGAPCGHMRVLPVFDLSLPRHASHHGSVGKGRRKHMLDCRNYCSNVVDTWNILFYNFMCF